MNPPNDHDLLIRLDEKVTGLIAEVKKLTDFQNKRIDDHERRIRRLERWMWVASGALLLLDTVLILWVKTR